MNKKEQIQILLSVFYTSESISRFIGDELPYSDLAIEYLKIEGKYSEIKKDYRKQFKGFTENSIETKLLDNKKKSISDLINSLKSELRFTFPKHSTKGEEKSTKFNLKGTKEWQEILLIFHSQCRKNVGEEVFLKTIPKEQIPKLANSLLKLGKAELQLEVLMEVREKIILNGIYKGIEEFETVPEACRSYQKDKSKDFDVEKLDDIKSLKEWFKECVEIIEDGDRLYDRYTINTRINSWVNHEKNKYDN